MKPYIKYFAFLMFAGGGGFGNLEAKEVIYFAGQSYSSNSESIDSLFRYTHVALEKNGNQQKLNQFILERIASNPDYSFVLTEKDADSRKYGKSTALALSIDGEIVSVEQIGGNFKVLYQVSAQALYFDFYEKQILGGFPFTLNFVEIFPDKPSEIQIQKTIDDYLFGSGKNPLAQKFIAAVNAHKIPQAASRRIKVKEIQFGEEAAKWIPASINSTDLKIQYGHEFSKYLSANADIAVLPSSVGRVIGNEMTAKFSNGDVYNLNIPEEDYSVSLLIKGLRKIEFTKNNVATVYIYGVGSDIEFFEPLSGKRYFSSSMKLGATKTVPITQENTDDWAAMNSVVLQLFDEFTAQIISPDKKWQQSHFGSDKSKELKILKKIVEESK